MGIRIDDAILDLQLDAAEGSTIHVCSAEPANYAAVAGLTLATQAIAGAHTKANGDVSGRKNTTPQQTDIPITVDGTANHVVHTNGADTILKIFTCTPQGLTSGGTVTAPAHDHEIADAA